jgi:hypothetical protein
VDGFWDSDLTTFELRCPGSTFITSISLSLGTFSPNSPPSAPPSDPFGALILPSIPPANILGNSTGTKNIVMGVGPIACSGGPSGNEPEKATAPAGLVQDAFGKDSGSSSSSSTSSSSEPFKSDKGFTGLNVQAGMVLDAVQFVPQTPEKLGKFVGGSGGDDKSITCPPGYLIVGLYGETGVQDGTEKVITIGLRCRQALTR